MIVQLNKWSEFVEHINELRRVFPNSFQTLEFYASPLWLSTMFGQYNLVEYRKVNDLFFDENGDPVIMSYYKINFKIKDGEVR